MRNGSGYVLQRRYIPLLPRVQYWKGSFPIIVEDPVFPVSNVSICPPAVSPAASWSSNLAASNSRATHVYMSCSTPGIVCLTKLICLLLNDVEAFKGGHHRHWHRNASNQHQHKGVMVVETDHVKTSSIRQELSLLFLFLKKKGGGN